VATGIVRDRSAGFGDRPDERGYRPRPARICEVENEFVVSRLATRLNSQLPGRGYQVVHAGQYRSSGAGGTAGGQVRIVRSVSSSVVWSSRTAELGTVSAAQRPIVAGAYPARVRRRVGQVPRPALLVREVLATPANVPPWG
jgi:hypothetical protein